MASVFSVRVATRDGSTTLRRRRWMPAGDFQVISTESIGGRLAARRSAFVPLVVLQEVNSTATSGTGATDSFVIAAVRNGLMLRSQRLPRLAGDFQPRV